MPCYNEEEAITIFYEETDKVSRKLRDYEFEFIFVNDGSKDNSISIMKSLAQKDDRVKYINFSKNFGKEAAMYAGLKLSSGDYVTTMDVDLQDPPILLIDMIKSIEEEGYDCVAAKSNVADSYSFLRKFLTKCFYKIIGKISKTEMVPGARDFRLMTRQMVDSVISMKEYNRYSKGLFSFVGFNTKWIEFENCERAAGTTKWSLWKLFSYAVDGIVGFSTSPLIISSFIGVLFCLISLIFIIVIIIKTLILGDPTSGWPGLVCIVFFVSGIHLFCIGIMGQYLSKVYLEVKNRPIYIVKDTNIKGNKNG